MARDPKQVSQPAASATPSVTLTFGETNAPRESEVTPRSTGDEQVMETSRSNILRPPQVNTRSNERAEPMGYFSNFQNSVRPGQRNKGQNNQDQIMIAFGQLLNEQEGRSPDPNYVIEMLGGRHATSETILNGYASSGQTPSRELMGVLDELDVLAESANALASMDPKVRTRLQGQAAGANLSVIKQREGELLRKANDIAREVVTASARAEIEAKQAQTRLTTAKSVLDALNDEAKIRQAQINSQLGEYDLPDLMDMQASGEYRQFGIKPAEISAHIADRTVSESAIDTYMNSSASATAQSVSYQVDSELLAAAWQAQQSGELPAETNALGMAVINLPKFGEVPVEIVEEALGIQADRSAKLSSSIATITPQQVQLIGQREETFAIGVEQAEVRLQTILSAQGISPQGMPGTFEYRRFAEANAVFNAKVQAAYEMGSVEEIISAQQLAYDEFNEKMLGIQDGLIANAGELKPAIAEIVASGFITSTEAAEKAIASPSIAGSFGRSIITNPALSETGSFITALAGSEVGIQAMVDSYRDASGDGGSANIDINAIISGDDAKPGDPNANRTVLMMRNPRVRAEAQNIFASESQGLYYASVIAREFQRKRAELTALPATPDNAEVVASQLDELNRQEAAILSRAGSDPRQAEFNSSAIALFNTGPLQEASGESVVGVDGQPISTTYINPRGFIASLATIDSSLEAAGVTDINLMDAINAPINEDAMAATMEHVSPRGIAQVAMMRMMMPDEGFVNDPNRYIHDLIASNHAAFVDDFRTEMQKAGGLRFEQAVSDDEIEAARNRYIRETIQQTKRDTPFDGSERGMFDNTVRGRVEYDANIRARVEASAAELNASDLILGGWIAQSDVFDIYNQRVMNSSEGVN